MKNKISKQPTVKQRRLIRGIVSGKTVAQAAVDAGYGNTPESARVSAHQALQKPTVRASLEAAFDRAGFSLNEAAEMIRDGARNGARGSQIDYLKLRLMTESKAQVDVDSTDRIFVGIIAERKSRGLEA